MTSIRWKTHRARLAIVLPAALVLAAGNALAQAETQLSAGTGAEGLAELRQSSTGHASSSNATGSLDSKPVETTVDEFVTTADEVAEEVASGAFGVADAAGDSSSEAAAKAAAGVRASSETAAKAASRPLDVEAVTAAVDGAVQGEVAGEIDASVRNEIRDAIEADLVTDITRSLPLPGND